MFRVRALWHGCSAFFSRQWLLQRKKIISGVVDGLIIAVCNTLLFVVWLPGIGAENRFVPNVLVGEAIGLCMFIGYGYGMEFALDSSRKGFFSYMGQLPLPLATLCGLVALNWALSMSLIVMIVLVLSVFLVCNVVFSAWLLCKVVSATFLIALFFGLLFMFFAVRFSFGWYQYDAWPRAIGPLFSLGAVTYSWPVIVERVPALGFCILLNPVVHAVEGMRDIIFPNHGHIPAPYALSIVTVWCVALYWRIGAALKKQAGV